MGGEPPASLQLPRPTHGTLVGIRSRNAARLTLSRSLSVRPVTRARGLKPLAVPFTLPHPISLREGPPVSSPMALRETKTIRRLFAQPRRTAVDAPMTTQRPLSSRG